MHKGIILLVKTSNKDAAISKVHIFLEPYGDGLVWDWFQIGGRWNNILAPTEKLKEFEEKANSIIIKENINGRQFISGDEIKAKQPKLQEAWESVGLDGQNSFCDHYQLPDNGNTYDVVPLHTCIEKVKEWLQDLNKEADKYWQKMVEAKAETNDSMSSYYARIYADMKDGRFCFDTNVYDISEVEAEQIPESIDEYYAVMVDLHN